MNFDRDCAVSTVCYICQYGFSLFWLNIGGGILQVIFFTVNFFLSDTWFFKTFRFDLLNYFGQTCGLVVKS